MLGCHILDTFSVEGESISFPELIQLSDDKKVLCDTIESSACKRFKNKNFQKNRFLAKCLGYIHGLALKEFQMELDNNPRFKCLTRKQRSNKFTNFQRADRGASKRLISRFKIENCIRDVDSLSDISQKLKIEIITVDCNGYVTDVQGTYKETVVFIDRGRNFYVVKSIKNFCK